MKHLKNFILFLVFGVIYCIIELLWRGYTDVTMGIVGGLAALIIGTWNERTALPLLP